jgi:ATP-dependent DNA helicase RecQ
MRFACARSPRGCSTRRTASRSGATTSGRTTSTSRASSASTSGAQRAPVACFTATAKPDVIDDLCAHFARASGSSWSGSSVATSARTCPTSSSPRRKAQKAQRIVELLKTRAQDGGAAVVFCATRKTAQTMSELVTAAGTPCGCFHGGLEPETKKSVQQRFMRGRTGGDRGDQRLWHGRRQARHPCRDPCRHSGLAGELPPGGRPRRPGRSGRPLRAAVRPGGRGDPVPPVGDVAADQEGLRQPAQGDSHPRQAAQEFRDRRLSQGTAVRERGHDDRHRCAGTPSTKVTTAIAWLERSGFLKRNENNSRVFPPACAWPRSRRRCSASRRRPAGGMRQRYNAVAATLFRSLSPEGVSTDELMLDAGIQPEECFRILHKLEELGILVNDLGLTVRHVQGVRARPTGALRDLDRARARTAGPDVRARARRRCLDGSPQHLTIRPLCTELRRRMGLADGRPAVSPQIVRSCLPLSARTSAPEPRSAA